MSTQRNLMANMKAFAELKRNAFDITNGHYYSQKCGEILPIKAIKTIPGDFMDVSISDKNLSFPMNTAAFLHARKEISAYHVPYNHIYSLFNQLQATRPDPKTSALQESPSVHEPQMALFSLYLNCAAQYYFYYLYEFYIKDFLDNEIISAGATNYTQLSYDAILSKIKKQYLETRLAVLSYQSGFLTVSSISVSEQIRQTVGLPVTLSFTLTFPDVDFASYASSDGISSSVNLFKDYVNTSVSSYKISSIMLDLQDRPRVFNWVRKLDMLGYGNLYPLLKMAEQHVLDQQLSKRLDISNNGFLPSLFLFLYNNIRNMSTYAGTAGEPFRYLQYVTLYKICSYNKVFYDIYRNSYYDLKYHVRNYNLDFCATSSYGSQIVNPSMFDFRFLDIEYHQWKKDIVTGALPEAQYGAVAGLQMSISANNLTTAFNNSYTNSSGTALTSIGDAKIGNSEGALLRVIGGSEVPAWHTHTISSATLEGALQPISFDVLSLKRAEMLQAYRQMLMRNGNRTIDIFKGLYGDKPASEDDNSSRFVDTFGSDLFVDTIVSTADTSQQNGTKGALGDLGARSVINSGGSFKFKTSDFGNLIFIGYIVPDSVYPSFGIDHSNTELDPESHFIPFFQNLGFQALHNYNWNIYYANSNGRDKFNVRGFAPSYPFLKTDVDLAHGNMVKLSSSSVQFLNGGLGNPHAFKPEDFVGSFNHWVPVRHDIVLSALSTLKQFYISPSFWDNIFLQSVTADYDSDHFIVDTHIFVKSVRKLSKLGLPNF